MTFNKRKQNFLNLFQAWVFSSFPTMHILTPNEMELIEQWERTGLPPSLFLRNFEHYLRNHNELRQELKSLQQLSHVAQQTIVKHPYTNLPNNYSHFKKNKNRYDTKSTNDSIKNAFELARSRIEIAGKNCQDDNVTQHLRIAWKKWQAQDPAKCQPNAKNPRPESPVQIQINYADFIDAILHAIYESLPGSLQAVISTLSPDEEQMLKRMDPLTETQQRWFFVRAQLIEYFGLHSLID